MPLPTIPSGNVFSSLPTGFNVDNSCRFNDGDSAHLTSDFSGTGSSSAAIATYSVWIKTSTVQTAKATIVSNKDDGSNYLSVRIQDQVLRIQGISPICDLISDRKFRDPSAWYHIVMAFDTAQSTASNRIKVWVNNEQITSWSTETYLAEDSELFLTKSDDLEIGQFSDDGSQFFDGYMAEFVCIDGTALTPSSFGEYDDDSPTIWKPKDVSGLTFGSKGYYLDFEDSAALGDDKSGNNNDFTENNIAAADQATDSPTNNFATLNPLDAFYTNSTFSEGNTMFASGSSYTGTQANILLTAGKWYWEVNVISKTGDTDNYTIGIIGAQATATNQFPGYPATGYAIYGVNGQIYNNNSGSTYAAAYAAGDIIGVALDLTNSKLYFSKDGAWADGSGSWDSTTFDAAVGAISITAPASTPLGGYLSSQTFWSGSGATFKLNFGNPAYANSSDVADENGYGAFEYAPPSGYLALCTKNLGSDGG